jgi:hypothetical protein
MENDWDASLLPFDSQQQQTAIDKQTSATSLAFMLYQLKQLALESKTDEVVSLLDEGIDKLFVYSDTFQLTKEKWLKWLSGELHPNDEPLTFGKAQWQEEK